MEGILHTATENFHINWDTSSYLYNNIINAASIKGTANNIGGEVFFYQYDLDLAFNGTEKEIFDIGDVVYWRSPKEPNKFGILFMYGNTSYGDGSLPRTSSPGIKIGTFSNIKEVSKIQSGISLHLK